MNERIKAYRRERERIDRVAPQILEFITSGVGPPQACQAVGVRAQTVLGWVDRAKRDILDGTNDSSQEERDFFYAYRDAIRAGYTLLQSRRNEAPTRVITHKTVKGVKHKKTLSLIHI